MRIKYQKRIGASRGFGLNISNAGFSGSYRTKYGTVGSRGFSIKTGIPGLTFRSGYRAGKNKGAIVIIFFAVIASGFVLYYSAVIAYNIIRFLWWAVVSIGVLLRSNCLSWKIKEVK